MGDVVSNLRPCAAPSSVPVGPRGRNHGGYHGETVVIDDVLARCVLAAQSHGWQTERLMTERDAPLLTLRRGGLPQWPRFYVSTGIHGDEPAGPLAVAEILEKDLLPCHANLWICACLNPTGFRLNRRESDEGRDLNRDYRHLRAAETRAHVAWLQRQPEFDLSLCLHEDWEATGFYLYELNPDCRPSLAEIIVRRVATVCPIDPAESIDGRPASGGIIRPNLDPASRPEWPEAFYLIQRKTRLSYTCEAPSDFALPVRVQALVKAVEAAVEEATPARTAGGEGAKANAPCGFARRLE
jgi:hypothetical protein